MGDIANTLEIRPRLVAVALNAHAGFKIAGWEKRVLWTEV